MTLTCLAWAASCRPAGDEALVARAILRDPAVVAVDGPAPANGLDGSGSLVLGEGWGRPEGDGGHADWGSMVWVVGQEAKVHLLPPAGGGGLDLFVRCLPFPWAAESPQQTLELLVGDRSLGRVDLLRAWQDLRFPLPSDLPAGRMVDLRLRFAHALKPLELGAADPRNLAAAFTQLAAIPRAVTDPAVFLAGHRFDPHTGTVVLPFGGGLRLPLPAASRGVLRLAGVQLPCQACRIAIELSGPDGQHRELGSAERDASSFEIGFETAAEGIHSLWLRVTGPEQEAGPAGARLVLESLDVWPKRRWWRRAGARLPHVFIYVIDTLRADALDGGGRPPGTPGIDAFSRDAVTHLQARAASSWTLPSVVSLLTGLYPDRHGVMDGAKQFDPLRAPALQQRLASLGYRSLGISHSFIVSSAYGLDSGFDDFFLSDHLNGTKLRSQEARGLLASWLSQKATDGPVFVYVHTVDPHAPYTPPAEAGDAAGSQPRGETDGVPSLLAAKGKAVRSEEIAHLRGLYDAEVRYADREFGRFINLLKWLGVYEDSYVVLTGDHGEEFGEHDGFEHGTTLFDEVLRVPLLIKYPGSRGRGRVSRVPVSLVDIAPTVLDGIAPVAAGTFDGVLLPSQGSAAGRKRLDYSEVAPAVDPSHGQAVVDLRALVAGQLKCLEDRANRAQPRVRAFDLAADPQERRQLAQESPGAERCRGLLAAWSAGRRNQAEAQRSRRNATPETLERLKSLGYL